MEVGGEGVIHLSLHCHHQNDFCNKLGAILMFHNNTDHNFLSERGVEADSNRGPSVYQPGALPLGQTGSPSSIPVRNNLCPWRNACWVGAVSVAARPT